MGEGLNSTYDPQEAFAEGFGQGINQFGQALSTINNYSVQNTGQPFQYDEANTSRRDRDRMKARVDKLNAEWQARQDEMRASLEAQRNKTHEFRMQSEEQLNTSMDLSNRFNAAMRMISKENKQNQKVEETAQRVFATADQDEALKDQLIQNWGA